MYHRAWDEMWRFETANFTVVAEIAPSLDADTSFDETGETAAMLESGDWSAFDTRVRVLTNGKCVGDDYLCESIYADPREFFHSHRTSPYDGRNTLELNAQKRFICHYFPEMVRAAIANARRTLVANQSLRTSYHRPAA